MEQSEHTDNRIKSLLESYVVQPRMTSLEAIHRKMEQKRRRRFWYIIFPAIGIIAVASGLFSIFQPDDILSSKENHLLKDPGIVKVNAHFNDSLISAPTNSSPDSEHQVEKEYEADKPATGRAANGTANILTNGEGHGAVIVSKRKGSDFTFKKEASFLPTVPSNTNAAPDVPAAINGLPPGNDSILFLAPVTSSLPQDNRHVELNLALNLKGREDSIFHDKTRQKIKYLVGLSFNPHLVKFHYRENENRDPVYDQGTPPVSEVYLSAKKKLREVSPGYMLGIRLVLNINDRWELSGGAGLQRFSEKSNSFRVVPTTINQGSGLHSGTAGKESHAFQYFTYSLEASRIKALKSLFRLKAGLGVQGNSYTPVNFFPGRAANNPHPEAASLRKNIYAIYVKGGIIDDLGRRVQFQLCPNIFYSVNSVYERNFIIKQNVFGAGLEALLLFKIK